MKLLRGSETGVGVSAAGNGVEDSTEVVLAGVVGECATGMVGFGSASGANGGVQLVTIKAISRPPTIAGSV